MAIEKRFPSDYRMLPTTKTMFSDDKIDMQLYNLFQCYSYPYPIKDEEGKITGYETRVSKKDLPTNKEIGELFSRPYGKDKAMTPITEKVIGQHLRYLTSPSAENVYCPYIEKRRDQNGVYYVLLKQERNYIMVPLEICNYLNNGYSGLAIKVYTYLFCRQDEQQRADGTNYHFTLTGLARHVGIPCDSPAGKAYIWRWPTGKIPEALLALKAGKLIDFKAWEDDNKHNFYEVTYIAKDLKEINKIIPKTNKATERAKRNAKVSEIIDNVAEMYPQYDPEERARKAKEAIAKIEAEGFHF